MAFWGGYSGAPRPEFLSCRMPVGDENRRAPPAEKKIYVIYQEPGESEMQQRQNITNAKEVSPSELARIQRIQAQKKLATAPREPPAAQKNPPIAQKEPSIARSSSSSSTPNEFIDGDLAKEAMKAGKDEKEVAELLQQMKADATRQAKSFKEKWRAYLQGRQRAQRKSPSKIFTSPKPKLMD